MGYKMSECARVIWIPSFVAFANTASMARAAVAGGASDKTIKNHVLALERWLYRVLAMEQGDDFGPSHFAYEFLPAAVEMLDLINDPRVYPSIARARVTPTGKYLLDGHEYRTTQTHKIASLLLKHRGDLMQGTPYIAPARIRGQDIDMTGLI